MPISSPARFDPGQRGFTLIELMIVIAIIGVATAAVALTLPDGRSRVREDAMRFALRVAGARDQAILASRPIAILVSPGGYSFSRREQGQWRQLEDRPFVTTNWRNGIRASGAGRFVFDGTGATEDEGVVTLVREGTQVPVLVRADGKVSVGG